MRVWVRWSAWLCLSLMLWAAAAESTHNHPTQTESASCSICMAAHSASPTVSSSQAAPLFAAIGLLQEKDVIAKARFDFSELGIRGPPAL
ncbi:MAG: hypothetical protein ABSE44_11255 [Candidatus Sulfotelmatobacter sp.]|jgi:hypothetical protein